MAVLETYRILTSPKRKSTSKSYRIHTNRLGKDDMLLLTIYQDKSKSVPLCKFKYEGKDISPRGSIHISADMQQEGWKLKFSGAYPCVAYIFK